MKIQHSTVSDCSDVKIQAVMKPVRRDVNNDGARVLSGHY